MPPVPERLTLPARVDSARPFCEFARRIASGAGFTGEELDRLDLVIEEIVVNIARYAYDQPETGEIELTCAVAGPRMLRVEISDAGRPFDPLARNPPDLSRGLADRTPGGLGIFLVKSIAESLAYRREGERNVLSFFFGPDATTAAPRSFDQ
jgi:serine/threonine-protein kinase RsbW